MHRIKKSDVNLDGRHIAREGRYLAVLEDAKARKSKKGDLMWAVTFQRGEDGAFLCYDTIMLEGKGQGIGLKKLLALGAAKEEGDEYVICDPEDARGLEVWLHIVHEEREAGGKRAVPDFNAQGFGYERVVAPQRRPDDPPF